MAAIAAVDTALWDIKAKVAGLPLYQLLGGRSRSGCLVYGHASGRDLPELFDSVRAHLEQGFRAIRIQTGIPGFENVYGVATSGACQRRRPSRYDHEPARRAAAPVEEVWDTRAYLRHVPAVFEAVRNEFGPELPLLHDAHHRLTPIQAAKLGKSLEPYDLFWLEDVTPAENQAALRLVRQHTTTPLAIGEVFNTIWDYQELIRAAADRLRPLAGHPRRRHHRAAPHLRLRARSTRSSRACTGRPTSRRSVWRPRCTSASPSRTSASRSTCGTAPPRTRCSGRTYTFVDGMLVPAEKPGLGVSYEDEVAAAHPYAAAYLPVNRLLDGSMHDR